MALAFPKPGKEFIKEAGPVQSLVGRLFLSFHGFGANIDELVKSKNAFFRHSGGRRNPGIPRTPGLPLLSA